MMTHGRGISADGHENGLIDTSENGGLAEKIAMLAEDYRRLGVAPASSLLLAEAFIDKAFIGHEAAARLLGMCSKTLTSQGDDGVIGFRVKGRRNRMYAEAEIIQFISGASNKEEKKRCPSINQSNRNTINTTSNGKGAGFMAQRAKLAGGERSRSKAA